MESIFRCEVKGLPNLHQSTIASAVRATQAAGSSALRAMRAEASRRIRERKGIKAGYIDIALAMISPSPQDPFVWRLVAKAKPLPLMAFGARQTKTGVSVEVTKGKRSIVRHAFIATMQSGHTGVFMRRGNKQIARKGRYVGKARQPIHELFTATVASTLGQVAPEVLDRGQSVFRSTFTRMMRPR